jgi:hypothetical protein
MLAERGLPTGSLDYWAVEPKLDGWRATVVVDDGRVVGTRRGHAITEMVAGLDALAGAGRRFLLDGELVANAGRDGYGEGRPSPHPTKTGGFGGDPETRKPLPCAAGRWSGWAAGRGTGPGRRESRDEHVPLDAFDPRYRSGDRHMVGAQVRAAAHPQQRR